MEKKKKKKKRGRKVFEKNNSWQLTSNTGRHGFVNSRISTELKWVEFDENHFWPQLTHTTKNQISRENFVSTFVV